MKNLFYFFVLVLIFIATRESNSQNPTYELTAKNFTFNNGCGYWNSVEFDIYLRSTGPVPLEYAGGQYFLSIDPSIANGGALSYELVNTDLPALLQPSGVSIGTATNPSATLMRMISIPRTNSGFFISSSFPGTKIGKMRVKTTMPSFTPMEPNIFWRDAPASVRTKIFATVQGAAVEITNPSYHNVEGTYCHHFWWNQSFPWCACPGVVAISIKSIIEGLYNTGSTSMNRADTVTVELRSQNSPSVISASEKLVLNPEDYFAYPIIYYSNEPLYIVIKHFNSIETWSKVPALYNSQVYYNYDFTDAATKAFGDNLKQVGDKFTIYSGDVNQDKVIDISDLNIIDNDSYNIVQGNFLPADLNADNIVDLNDVQIADNNAFNLVTARTPLN